MSGVFDPEVIRVQISNLQAERDRIDRSIQALEIALNSMQGVGQQEFVILPHDSGLSLLHAVKSACMEMHDGITRQRVLQAIERLHPFLKPNPSSVSAALINLSKGEEPFLYVAESGSGRRPAVYSIEDDMVLNLNSDEIQELMDPSALRGTGGWQSLWSSLVKNFDRSSGTVRLSPALRARIHHYYRSYGVGGWQSKARKVFRRHLSHLFS